jgi:hypothetical protein
VSQQADAAHAREVGFFSATDPVKGTASSGKAKVIDLLALPVQKYQY